MINPEIKTTAISLLGKITEFVKSKINSIRIPRLLSFFITKDGKIDPTLEETLKEAPPADQNWIRLGLDKKVFGVVPMWLILALPVILWLLSRISGIIIFFIDFGFKAIALVLILWLCYFIFKSLKKNG